MLKKKESLCDDCCGSHGNKGDRCSPHRLISIDGYCAGYEKYKFKLTNVYKSLLEAIGLTSIIIGLAGFLGFEMWNPILDGILFFSIWGKSYQYYSKKGTNAE